MTDQFAQQARQDYVENRVFSAHPVERIQMLYQVAIDSILTAIERLKDGEIFARGHAVNKAHAAVDELNFALDHSIGAKFTHRLSALYDYVQMQLVKGHSHKSEQAFREALSVLATLAETWQEVVAQTCGTGASSNRIIAEPVPDMAARPEPRPSSATAETSEPYAAYSGVLQGSSTSRDWNG